jgi:hypothetical protein
METTIPMSTPDAAAVLEQKRIQFYRFFLIATIINNVFLAVLCFGANGGPALAAAPAWVVTALGALGAATAPLAVLALARRKLGAIGVVVTGVAAGIASLAGGVIGFGLVFLFATAFWAFIAKRNWYRLV